MNSDKYDNLNLTTLKRNFSEKNINKFCEEIEKETWWSVYNGNNTDECFSMFHKTFMLYFDKYFKLEQYRSKHTPKNWVTEEIKSSSSKLKQLFANKKKNPNLSDAYKVSKKAHFSLIRETKKNFFQNRIMNSNNLSKSAWKIINEVTKKKDNNQNKNITINSNNKIEKDPQKLANLFNAFFINIPKKITNNLPPAQSESCLGTSNINSIFIKPIDKYELKDIIEKQLKPKFSAGYDDIPNALIKKSFEYFLEPLVFLINISFEQGKFP